MNMLRRIVGCTVVGLWLTSCSHHDASKFAPIKHIGGKRASSAPAVGDSKRHIAYSRDYDSIPKGSYGGGSTYTVKRGDTLFYIAWITGNDFRDLAGWNNIPAPYRLRIGQSIQLENDFSGMPKSLSSGQIQIARVDSTSINAYSENSGKRNVGKMLLPSNASVATTVKKTPVAVPSNYVSRASAGGSTSVGIWKWPTDGKTIDSSSTSENGRKGIDIAGSRGQPVVSAADGRVVYAGNALRGYGNLIIVKHSDDYISAYAHNDTMLVREQQKVKVGQKIATMGSTGTSSVRLHFEIRYKGKSVNPLLHLPQR